MEKSLIRQQSLIDLNRRGIFPGPSEQWDRFFKRALAAKPVSTDEALQLTEKMFCASPNWVNITFKKKGLLPWEGAATWIEENEQGDRLASIQMKPSLIASLYPQTEVIAHEMVHAMRLMFEESRFEEILAFRTSNSRFRRYFGPLFTRPSEAMGLVVWLLCSWLFYWTELIVDFSLGAKYLLWSPILAFGWGIWRLGRSQTIFSLALNHLEKAIKKPEQSLAVALRLTDVEIEQFAKCSPEEILTFVHKEKEASLRWTLLFSAYF